MSGRAMVRMVMERLKANPASKTVPTTHVRRESASECASAGAVVDADAAALAASPAPLSVMTGATSRAAPRGSHVLSECAANAQLTPIFFVKSNSVRGKSRMALRLNARLYGKRIHLYFEFQILT